MKMAWRKPERFINCLSFQHLKNTVELDLSGIFGRGMFPNKKEIHEFIAGELQVKADMIRGVQHHPRFPKVFLQFETEQQAEEVENRVKDGLIMQSKGIRIFGHRCDTPSVNIILNGQDMSTEKEEIERVMAKYGTLVTCERGRNMDLSTKNRFVTDGTWQIRLKPKPRTKPPETIYYFGASGAVETWILNYDGVTSSCVYCGQIGHMGFRCNARVNSSGIGQRPAGLGKWTDVAAYKAPPAPAGPAQEPPDQGGNGAGDPAQLDDEGGDKPGQAVARAAQPGAVRRGGYHDFLPASQEVQRIAALDERARESGWGKVASQEPQQRPQEDEVAAVARDHRVVEEQPKKKGKKKRNTRQRKEKKREVAEVAISNRFESLTDESEDEEDDFINEVTRKQVKSVSIRTTMLNRYGSRRRAIINEVGGSARKRKRNLKKKRIGDGKRSRINSEGKVKGDERGVEGMEEETSQVSENLLAGEITLNSSTQMDTGEVEKEEESSLQPSQSLGGDAEGLEEGGGEDKKLGNDKMNGVIGGGEEEAMLHQSVGTSSSFDGGSNDEEDKIIKEKADRIRAKMKEKEVMKNPLFE